MDNLGLFEALFGKCKDSITSIMTLPDKQIRHYPSEQLEEFYKEGIELGKTTNTYFSVWPRRSDIPSGIRGGSADTVYATCLFADYDVAGPAHKEKNLPPSKELVLEHLKGLEKPPTVIIDTGYGLDPFWIFKEPVLINDENTRDRVSRILTGYGKHLSKLCKELCWSLDNVFEPARMLRFFGSNNFKLESQVPCRILWESGIFYSIEDFDSYYEVQKVESSETFITDDRTVGSAERIMERCLAVQKMLDDPESINEPLWHALCSNIALTPDGEDKFHEWSSPYSEYTCEETEYKLHRAQEVKKPCTCAYIKEGLGFSCPEGGCGVKAPVVLALYTKEEQIQNLLAKDSLKAENVFEDYTLKLMAYAREHRPADYSLFKLRVKKLGISLRDFERAVRNMAEKYMSASAELLGLQKFDKAVFESKVRQITVTGPNDLEYEFVNGSKSKYTWQDASRRDSWTEEMRSQAREKAYQRRISRC